jgi:hypothetical protein
VAHSLASRNIQWLKIGDKSNTYNITVDLAAFLPGFYYRFFMVKMMSAVARKKYYAYDTAIFERTPRGRSPAFVFFP